MERKHRSGVHYFGIYVDPDPYSAKRGLDKINNTKVRKSERNQKIADEYKTERQLGLLRGQITDVERAIIRTQRQERLSGVTLYVRDAVPSHGKGLIPEIIDCA